MFFESKFLVLGFFILCFANVALIVTAVFPFYYLLRMRVQLGTSDPFDLNVDCGLFYLTMNFHSNLFLEKLDNHIYATNYLTLAQLFFVAGLLGTLGCNFVALLMALKKYMSVPANIILGGTAIASAMLLVISDVLGCIPAIDSMAFWSKLPSTATTVSFGMAAVALNWTFYVAVVGTVAAILGAVCLLVEACKSTDAIKKARRAQLSRKPAPVSPEDRAVEKYSYVRNPRRGPPAPAYAVTYQSGGGGGPPPPHHLHPPTGHAQPPRGGGYSPQAPPAYSRSPPSGRRAPPSPEFIPPVRAPPSPRGGYVSRQIEI